MLSYATWGPWPSASPGVNIPNRKDRHLLPKPGGLARHSMAGQADSTPRPPPSLLFPRGSPSARSVSCPAMCAPGPLTAGKRPGHRHHHGYPVGQPFSLGNMRARSWPPQPQVPKNFLCTAHSLQTGQCSEQLLHHEERIPGCGQTKLNQ